VRTKRNRARLRRLAWKRGMWRVSNNIRLLEDVFLRWCTRDERAEYLAIRP